MKKNNKTRKPDSVDTAKDILIMTAAIAACTTLAFHYAGKEEDILNKTEITPQKQELIEKIVCY